MYKTVQLYLFQFLTSYYSLQQSLCYCKLILKKLMLRKMNLNYIKYVTVSMKEIHAV